MWLTHISNVLNCKASVLSIFTSLFIDSNEIYSGDIFIFNVIRNKSHYPSKIQHNSFVMIYKICHKFMQFMLFSY